MATIQKTTLKRYNGTDWDPIYLATSSDIVTLAAAHTVAAGAGFTISQEIAAGTTTESLITQIIDNLTQLDKVTVPALQGGSGITSIDASKITGVIDRDNLPADVGGKGVQVDDEQGKDELTASDVNIGDIVKVAGGATYLVTAVEPAVTYMTLTDEAAQIAWSRITGTPTTLTGYGITDAVNSADVVTSPAANKILKLDGSGKLPASITGDAATLGGNAPAYYATESDLTAAEGDIATLKGQVGALPVEETPGTGLLGDVDTLKKQIVALDASAVTTGVFSIDRIPQAALERLYVAENDEARLALTTAEVQNGDVVKVTETGLMYYVKDQTKLGGETPENAFEPFTAGAASSVPWSGVTSTPTTLDGYGITDAVKASEKAANYVEGSVVIWKAGTDGASHTYQIEGKAQSAASADVATNATQLNGHDDSYFATSSDMTTVQQFIESMKDGTVEGIQVPADTITGTIQDANLPDSVKFAMVEVANTSERLALLNTQVQNGDVVKQTDTGALYFVINAGQLASEAGYQIITTPTIAWGSITGKPTTVAGYGITDAVTDEDVSTTYEADHVVGWAQGTNDTTSTQYDINGKANTACLADRATTATTADNATQLNGQAASYYATASALSTVQGNVTTIQGQIGTAGPDGSGILKDIEDLKSGDAITSIAATKITGVLDLANIPASVVERLTIVEDDEARLALTTATVQNGDTVKVAGTGLMYFVKDDTKLGGASPAEAFEPYTVGSAASVPWSGVTDKPTTLVGYGITDAVAASEKVTSASSGNAGKILVLNAEGKLDADITGHVEWDNVLNKPASTPTQIDQAVTAATHTNRATLDKFSESDGKLMFNGAEVAMASTVTALSSTVANHTTQITKLGLGCLTVVDDVTTDLADAAEGQLALELI